MRFLALAAVAAPALGVLAEAMASPEGAPPPPSVPPQEESSEPGDSNSADARALYVEHCASCHGETGDGKGTTELDRPARSFLDGGYSYGNTQKAVVRSVTHGIPGTPMPAFGETLTEDQIKAVADYVIGLGPEGTIVEPGASVMTVEDRPSIVTGKIPPLKNGGLEEPRALVVGFPNGTTFAYGKQQGELRAILVGDFLDRADWGGRGGAALRPLGNVVWRADDAADASATPVADGEPVACSIRAAAAEAATRVRLDVAYTGADGKPLGGGQEFITFVDVAGVPVTVRFLLATGSGATFAPLESKPIAVIEQEGFPRADVRKVTERLFAIDMEGADTARVLVHADKWSSDLGRALTGDAPEETEEARAPEATNEGGDQ